MATEPTILKPQQPSTSTALAQSGETSAVVLAEAAKAEILARYYLARENPRDFDEVREAIIKECRRPRFASSARYSVPRGMKKNEETGKLEKKFIKGFSIRFAEAMIRCMRNVAANAAAIYDDREKRTVRVSVTDIQNNVPYSQDITIQKTVERRTTKAGDEVLRQRLNSNGEPVYIIAATDDELLNKQNALVSKAIRTLGMRLVPGDIQDECLDEITRTLEREDKADPDAAKKKLLDAFVSVGVSVTQLKDYIGHDLNILNPQELSDLRNIFTALRDGETNWREVMDGRTVAEAEAGQQKPAAKEQQQPAAAATRTDSVLNKVKAAKINQAQVTRFHTIASKASMTDGDKDRLLAHHGFESSKDITTGLYDQIIADIESGGWAEIGQSQPLEFGE